MNRSPATIGAHRATESIPFAPPTQHLAIQPTSTQFAVAFYLCALCISVLTAHLMHGLQAGELGRLSNLMGPLAESLVHGNGFVVCTDAMTAAGDTICYHAARMPLPPVLLSVLIRIIGEHFFLVQLAKIALVLLPVAAAVKIVCHRIRSASLTRRILVPTFLFCALILPMELIDVINMQVEEGYSFCFLILALALLLFGQRGAASWRSTIFFALSVLALYLTKSSMVAAAAFLALAYCFHLRDGRQRLAVLLMIACGPVGWGLYTLRSTGHFSIGTSLDGINLHKGNNAQFLDRYPPSDDGSLDRYDHFLNAGHKFGNEWSFNAFHMQAAEQYIQAHPQHTVHAVFRKAQVFFISLRKIGSAQYSCYLGEIVIAGMVMFRLLLWAACATAFWFFVRGPNQCRRGAFIYLGTVTAVTAPYLAGFALTRHAGILILPSALFLIWITFNPRDNTVPDWN